MKHNWGEVRGGGTVKDGLRGGSPEYRICQKCGMSDLGAGDKPCPIVPLTCKDCKFREGYECYRYPPHTITWIHPDAGIQFEPRYSPVGPDSHACGEFKVKAVI